MGPPLPVGGHGNVQEVMQDIARREQEAATRQWSSGPSKTPKYKCPKCGKVLYSSRGTPKCPKCGISMRKI